MSVRIMDAITKAPRTNFPSEDAVVGKARKRVENIIVAARGRPKEDCHRNRKVQAIRRRLKLGRYDINSRLDAILDKLLDDLLT